MSQPPEYTIGSSDVPHLMAGRFWEVWMRIFYPKDVDRGNLPEFERGRRLEPVLASWYTEEYQVPLRKCETIYHPNYPWMRATADYEELAGDGAYVEMKSQHWVSAPSTCAVEHEFQVRYQMAVGGRKQGYVWAWYMKDLKPVRWSFPRNPGTEERMLRILIEFYEAYVREKQEPPRELSQAYATYLNHQPAKEEGLTVEGEHPLAVLMDGCRKWGMMKALSKAKYEALTLELREAMKNLGWVKSPAGTARYGAVTGSTKRDWEQIARWLGVALMNHMPKDEAEKVFQGIVQQFTTVGQNYRRLSPRWTKGPLFTEAEIDEMTAAEAEEVPLIEG